MTYILNLIGPLNAALVSEIRENIQSNAQIHWLAENHACDIPLQLPLFPDRIRELRHQYPTLDINIVPVENRRKKLLVADMDSTMIQNEVIDEMADNLGLKKEIAAITESAMRGEIDFPAALRQRVALLKGLDQAALETTYKKLTLTPGGKTLIQTMKKHGSHTALVSGGFTWFTQKIAADIGFNEQHGNELEIQNGKLTGNVIEPIFGADSKQQTLETLINRLKLGPQDTLAVGDGANDIPMLEFAGLGVAFHAKPKTRNAVKTNISHNDLTALLYLQGYTEKDIKTR